MTEEELQYVLSNMTSNSELLSFLWASYITTKKGSKEWHSLAEFFKALYYFTYYAIPYEEGLYDFVCTLEQKKLKECFLLDNFWSIPIETRSSRG